MIFGVDLSNYQAGISLAGVRGEGFDFAFCKVTQGYGYRSPDWPRQRDEARAAGLILAGYHYIDSSDPRGQAANCRAHLADPTIPVALDCEAGSGDIGQYRAVLDAFQAAGMRVALSYLPRWYWQQIGQPSLAGLPPLWSSRYPSSAVDFASNLYAGVTAAHWSGYGGGSVAVLQFASTAKVQGRQVDANCFAGTRDELIALLYGGPGSPGNVATSTPKGPFMALSDADQALILEAAKQSIWGLTGVRDAGQTPMALVALSDEVKALRDKLDELAARPAVAVDPAAVQAAITSALGGGLTITGTAVPANAPKG